MLTAFSKRALPFASQPLALAGIAASALFLAACGGGGGSSGTTATTMSGVVIDGLISGATVCLDLNKNGNCDAGEPTSLLTDAQGQYAISGLTPEQMNAGAPLIAMIPATATDTGVAVGTAFALLAPAGKGAVISPFTHLIQTGIAGGLTQAAAEAAVAAQLKLNSSSLYNNYVGATGTDNAALAALAPILVAQLKIGVPLNVTAPTTGTPGYWVRSLDFTNSANYSLRYYLSDNTPNSAGLYSYYDKREEKTNGIAVAKNLIYATVTATSSGWVIFDDSTPGTNTAGSPDIWNLNGFSGVSTRTDIDVSGMTVAQVIAMAQDTTVNTQSTIVGVTASALTGTMPSGAKVRRITSIPTSNPVYYVPSNGSVSVATTLASVLTAYPVPTAPTGNNTISMGNLHGNAACGTGATVCPQERLRAAFGSANAVNYYLCDLTVATNASSNCQGAGTGTYNITTAADGNTPIMMFAGLPAAASVQTSTRVLVQRNGVVYYGDQDKLITSKMTRLNKAAYEVLAAQLGLTPPTLPIASVPAAGTWNASYGGSDTGSCTGVSIGAQGNLSGSCISTHVGGTFTVSGTVSADGTTSFTATGATNSGAVFSGAFSSTTATGTWTWPGGGSGTWTATKQ